MFLGCTLTLLFYMCPQLWRYLCSGCKLDPVSSVSTKIKYFLLKIYLKNHELKIDGNMDQCISTPINITMWKQSRYRIRKHERSKRAKISTLAFPAYTSILMCSNNNSWHTTKSVVSFEKDYKIPLYPIKIPRQFGFHMYAIVKTHITCR